MTSYTGLFISEIETKHLYISYNIIILLNIDEVKMESNEHEDIKQIVKDGKKHCLHCGYVWTSRVKMPKQCPRCKRYF